MVTSGLYLEKRFPRKDGTCIVKIRIIKDRKVSYVSTSLYCLPEEWENNRVMKSAANSMQKNALLNKWMSEIDGFLMENERRGELERMTLVEIVSVVERIVRGESATERKQSLCDVLDEMIERRNYKSNTRDLYIGTREKVQAYSRDVKLSEVTTRWLEGFQSWMIADGLRVNSIGIHMRNLRAVFNFALDEEYTTNYPFRKFKIKKEETEKRCLSVEQLRTLRDYKVEEHQEVYRDMFMLMFYMVGVNAIDLFHAKKEQMQEDRLVYRREKTGTLYSIKVQPEAMEIIDKYRGEGEYLLNVMDRYKNYKDFLHRMNMNLREIGEVKRVGRGGKKERVPMFADISSYWSRHTWATIAAEIDIPIEVISHALGHKIGSDVTSIYVKFNRMKVDEANRKVIDYIKG